MSKKTPRSVVMGPEGEVELCTNSASTACEEDSRAGAKKKQQAIGNMEKAKELKAKKSLENGLFVPGFEHVLDRARNKTALSREAWRRGDALAAVGHALDARLGGLAKIFVGPVLHAGRQTQAHWLENGDMPYIELHGVFAGSLVFGGPFTVLQGVAELLFAELVHPESSYPPPEEKRAKASGDIIITGSVRPSLDAQYETITLSRDADACEGESNDCA